MAAKPTFSEFWESLKFDPFSASYSLVLRLWHAIGLAQSDLALRGLGLVIGPALIVAATSLQSLSGRAHMRMTNCDKISAVVENRAGPDDLVILTSPLYGIQLSTL